MNEKQTWRRGPQPWKLPTEKRTALLQAYIAGDKTEAIAAEFGVARGYVPMLAKRAGLPRRSNKETTNAI